VAEAEEATSRRPEAAATHHQEDISEEDFEAASDG
jgi:hypothetical protein